MTGRPRSGLLAGVGVAVLAGTACGQCEPGWSEAFPRPFFRGGNCQAVSYDDGTGPRLIVWGLSRTDDPGPEFQVWDGAQWTKLQFPNPDAYRSLALSALNDQDPPRLAYASTEDYDTINFFLFQSGVWQSIPFDRQFSFAGLKCIVPGPETHADDIYVAGSFRNPDGTRSLVLRWDNGGWTSLDHTSSVSPGVDDLAWFDDGAGMALYAAVLGREIDGVSIDGVARWDGQVWSPVGESGPRPSDLEIFDDGAGPSLWALERDVLSRWDSQSWTEHSLEPDELRSGADNLTVAVLDGRQELFWTLSGPHDSVLRRWDGIDGEPIANTVGGRIDTLVADVEHDGLIAVGSFTRIGGITASNVARWDGHNWEPLGNTEIGNGTQLAEAMLSVGDEGGPEIGRRVYLGSPIVAGEPTGGVATWDGASWRSIGPGPAYDWPEFTAFLLTDLGSATRLVASGHDGDYSTKSRLHAWDGLAWTTLPGEISGGIGTMVYGSVPDREPTLYVGGGFGSIDGQTHYSVAGLDADGWFRVGNGMPSSIVNSLVIHDDGTGPQLYAGGDFGDLWNELRDGVLRWDGHVWRRVGAESFPEVRALCAADVGDGLKLFAAGDMYDRREGPFLAAWDGVTWTPIEGGPTKPVDHLTLVDTAQGPALAAVTESPRNTGAIAHFWHGDHWTTLDGQIGTVVAFTQAAHEGGSLYFAGEFSEVDGIPSEGIARFGCNCPADFNADGTLDTRDFVAFLNAWAAGDPAADFDGNGVLDTRDFIAYLGAWAAGC